MTINSWQNNFSCLFSSFKQNIALAIVNINYSNLNQKLIVNDGNSEFNAVVVNKPFYDPNKNLTKS